MRRFLQILLPLLVLGGATAWLLHSLRNMPAPAARAPAFVPPLVRVVVAAPEQVRLDVQASGTVEARTSVVVSSQVAGRVREVSHALRAGGFFAAGETLVAVEREDFEFTLVQRKAELARAEVQLMREQAEAEAALRAWRQVEGERAPSALVAREPQLAEARALVASAQAQVRQAELNLTRTAISLPFAGRVRRSMVDVGQYVMTGQALAEAYATDVAEVRLPIAAEDLAFVELPMLHEGDREPHGAAEVTLAVDFAGSRHEWQGVIERTEGEIDRRTRQLTAVGRVDAPYAAGGKEDRPPLKVGMFVQATIKGRTFDGVVTLPRGALRPGNVVLVLDGENRLRFRTVDVLRTTRTSALVRSGLTAGERVCVSPLEAPVEGMVVRIADEPTAAGQARPEDSRR